VQLPQQDAAAVRPRAQACNGYGSLHAVTRRRRPENNLRGSRRGEKRASNPRTQQVHDYRQVQRERYQLCCYDPNTEIIKKTMKNVRYYTDD